MDLIESILNAVAIDKKLILIFGNNTMLQYTRQNTPNREMKYMQINTKILNPDSQKFKNKFHIKSHRRPHWDYFGNGYYFITIVTKNRKCILGDIINKNGYDHVETHGRASLQQTSMVYPILVKLLKSNGINHLKYAMN